MRDLRLLLRRNARNPAISFPQEGGSDALVLPMKPFRLELNE